MQQVPCNMKGCLSLLREECNKKLSSLSKKTGAEYNKFNAIKNIISDDRFMYIIRQETLFNIIKDVLPSSYEEVYKTMLKEMILN